MSTFELGPNQLALVEALESDKYLQTTGQLRRRDISGQYGYCVMGVACDISCVSTWTDDFYSGNKINPLDEVREFFGLAKNWCGKKSEDGKPLKGPMDMNDSGRTLKEIAAVLRKYPEAYFTGPK